MSNTDADMMPVEHRFEWSHVSPSFAVVKTIAAIENVGMAELSTLSDITLNDYVDPDALDTLVRDGDVTVSFSVEEYRIHIDGNLLVVTTTDAPHGPTATLPAQDEQQGRSLSTSPYTVLCSGCGKARLGRRETNGIEPIQQTCPDCEETTYTVLGGE